jgi:hypothetical protein
VLIILGMGFQAVLAVYQTRNHLNYRRALYNMLPMRTAAVPNEPSPISGHSLPALRTRKMAIVNNLRTPLP